MMRIAVIGTVLSTDRAVQVMTECGYPPVGIFGMSEVEGRRRHSDYSCKYRAATIWNADTLASYFPDFLFVFGWSRLIGSELLNIPTIGSVGLHPSYLPEGRGRHPIIWSVIHRHVSTGLTFFWLDETADTGDIISQERILMDERETATTLYDKVLQSIDRQLPPMLEKFRKGIYPRAKQDGLTWTYRKRTREDGVIDLSKPVEETDALIRALAPPYPGAELIIGERSYRVFPSD